MIDPVRAQSSKLVDRSMITRGCLRREKESERGKEENLASRILVHLLRLRQQTQKTGTSKCDPWQTPTLFHFTASFAHFLVLTHFTRPFSLGLFHSALCLQLLLPSLILLLLPLLPGSQSNASQMKHPLPFALVSLSFSLANSLHSIKQRLNHLYN